MEYSTKTLIVKTVKYNTQKNKVSKLQMMK